MAAIAGIHEAMVEESMLLARGGGAGESPAAEGRPAVRFDFDSVYAEHAAFVWRVLRGMGVAEAQLDDAVQDVFLVVHRRLPEFDGASRVRTWLFSIASRVASHYRRRARRTREQLPVGEDLRCDLRSPLDRALDGETVRRLQRTLDGLDDEKRALLILAELEEMSAPEIAELTGAPLNTVYTRLRRARLAFGELWRKWREP